MDFFLKPKDYKSYTETGIQKIIKTIDSSKTIQHFETCKKMIDNFIIILLMNDVVDDEDLQFVSKQLYLYMNIIKLKVLGYASNEG